LSDTPDAEPDKNEEFSPTAAQGEIIRSDTYPMRVLAGAGTGKTFTMVRKIRRLLEEEGVPPGDILALTFTNKAADSIRAKLVAELGPRGHDIDAYTYHAIGETILRDHAYQAGMDPSYEIATEVDQLAFIYESLDAIPYQFTTPRVAAPDEHGGGVASALAAFIPQMKGEGIAPDRLRAYLGPPERLLALGEVVDRIEQQAETLLDFGQWRKPSAERLTTDMIEPLETLADTLREERAALGECGLEADVRAFLTELVELCDALRTVFETRQDEIIDGPLEPAFRLPALLFNAKYGDGDATGVPKVASTPLDRLRTVIETCQRARDLTEGYAAYERQLAAASLVDFGDLVTRARRLFTDGAAGDAPNTGWQYVFCDEFQDTDTVQFDLVAELVGDGNLFVVGDTYQAIYEWRGANIDNIDTRLTEEFAPADASLGTNFRSYEPILELANEAFRRHPNHEGINELTASEPSQQVDRGVATITAPEVDGRGAVIDAEGEAEQIAEAVRQLLSGETDLVREADLVRQEDDDREAPTGYRPEDIAILVRATRHARPIIAELEASGIPYALGGSLATESPGAQTVIAYLKLLANPDRDGSLNRVLTMRYRVHDADLRTLNRAADDRPLSDVLLTADLTAMDLEEPDRVRGARADLAHLLSIRDTHSLTGLYEELKETTRIEWFLSESEREDLEHLGSVIADYGRERVQPELSEAFIKFLQYNATAVLDGGGAVQDQPDTTAGAVNIMTVHKSKGLEFPVVMLPQLTADEWRPRQEGNAALRHAVGDASASPFDGSLMRRDEYEQRRAFHVAVTRAQNLCVLSGRSEGGADMAPDEGLSRDQLAELLPPALTWAARANRFPIWETVQKCLPASAVDWTAALEAAVTGEQQGMARTTDGDEITLAAAYDRVLTTAQAAVDGTGTPVEPATVGLPATPIEPAPVDLLPKHSYTSISAYERCPRQHYLEYVVDAFDDPPPAVFGNDGDYNVGTDAPTAAVADQRSDVSLREVGILFHKVAERADKRTYATTDDRKQRWLELARSLPGYDDQTRAKVRNCIEMFFRTPVSEWQVTSTERRFDFVYDDHRIVGQIDAVCETAAGETVVVDYKTGMQQQPEERDHQLLIYYYAANRQQMIGNVDRAAYVYVNDALDLDAAARFDDRSYSRLEVAEQMDALSARIGEIERTTYETAAPDAGVHCYGCAHRSLPCSTQFDDEEQ
jgi:DNA helicase-2/ATP-dependent DNA helicase PcrA